MVLVWLTTNLHHPPLSSQGLFRVSVFVSDQGTPGQVAPSHHCVLSPAITVFPWQSSVPGLQAKPCPSLPATKSERETSPWQRSELFLHGKM